MLIFKDTESGKNDNLYIHQSCLRFSIYYQFVQFQVETYTELQSEGPSDLLFVEIFPCCQNPFRQQGDILCPYFSFVQFETLKRQTLIYTIM